jgi:hypothetical protein
LSGVPALGGIVMISEFEVMRVLRLPPRGKLAVEIGNRRYEQLAEIEDPALRQRVTAAIGELIDFAGGYNVLVVAGVAPAPVLSSQTAAKSGPPADEELRRRQEEFLESLERERDALKMAARAPMRRPAIPLITPTPLPDSNQPAARIAATHAKPTLVEEIDAVLQKYVAADPSLAGRSIHLEQAAGGGLRICVDGRYFQRPGDIEERAIQLALKMALKEWEGQ